MSRIISTQDTYDTMQTGASACQPKHPSSPQHELFRKTEEGPFLGSVRGLCSGFREQVLLGSALTARHTHR